MKINNSYELLEFLKQEELLTSENEYWWPSNNDFEILLGSILTQNTKWENVLKSLENLRKINVDNLDKLANVNLSLLIDAIAPSGFKNQKSVRLIKLSENILRDFENFEFFKNSVTRDWLLAQKGIGPETADCIMCYVCKKDYMVVDKYTNDLLKSYSYVFESYEQIQDWIIDGINENYDKIAKLYGYNIPLYKLYARFHGKIIEYMKKIKRQKR